MMSTMTYNEALQILEPYMEVLDPDFLNTTIERLESIENPELMDRAALGIMYHELCVVHYLRGKDKAYAPYAQKSLDVLRGVVDTVPSSARPIIDAYIVSARSLVASVKSNLIELISVIRAYDKLIARDGVVCYCPLFLQGSLLENVPNLFGAHAKAARRFREIIAARATNPDYASDKIVGFCYLSLSRFEKNAAKNTELTQQALSYDHDGTIASIISV